MKASPLYTKLAAVVLLALIVLAAAWTHHFIVRPDIDDKNDLYYDFLEAERLIAGENPYERILSGDMRNNQKYATYFPLFYLLSAGVLKLGFQEFQQYVAFWRLGFLFLTSVQEWSSSTCCGRDAVCCWRSSVCCSGFSAVGICTSPRRPISTIRPSSSCCCPSGCCPGIGCGRS